MTRMYMRNYEEKYLEMMAEVIGIYLKYFSSRTIVCSLRDFIEEVRWNGENKSIPQSHKEKVDYIVKRLVRQGLMLDKLDSQSDNASLPLKKIQIDLLMNTCMTMLEYSYGRHTYMPSTCAGFIKANWDILPDSFLREVRDFLLVRNESISYNAPMIEKIDDKTWLLFEEEISMELISRDSYRKVKEIEMSKIEKQIVKLSDVKNINTQRNCREVIASLDGIKRHVVLRRIS